MSDKFIGTWRRVINGKSSFGRVTLQVEESQTSGVRFACDGEGYISQGYLEEAPPAGYDDWKVGAAVGALFALHGLNHKASLVITKVEGLTSDTNPSFLAAAAAEAVWKALGGPVDNADRSVVEKAAFHSQTRPFNEIPLLQRSYKIWAEPKYGEYTLAYGLVEKVGTKQKWATTPTCSHIEFGEPVVVGPGVSRDKVYKGVPCHNKVVYRIRLYGGQIAEDGFDCLTCSQHRDTVIQEYRKRIVELTMLEDLYDKNE